MSPADSMRAERDELLVALKQCQAALAVLVAREAVPMISLLHAWAGLVTAEAQARKVIAKAENR